MSGGTLALGGQRTPTAPDNGRALRLTLDAWPLTPIHIGDGSRLPPEQYLLEGDTLCRFEPARAVATMPPAQRVNYLAALDRGDLGGAQRLLRAAVRDEAIVERVPVSEASQRELRAAIETPELRRGEVRPFIRTGGRPFIPGTSIKGALRTALASYWLPADIPPAGLTHDQAMQAALGLTGAHDTDSDPLRFLSVADVELPGDATLIDQPRMMKRGRDAQPELTSVQMHVERLRCSADPGALLKLPLSITLRPCPPGWQGRRIDRPTLFRAINAFHWAVWQKERGRFFLNMPETSEAMDRLMANVKVHGPSGAESTLAREGPGVTGNFLLLRLGRFGHFESKSLARVRQGHVPQAHDEKYRRADEYGSTRTVISYPARRAGDRGLLLPMGWLLARVAKSEEIGA